ncbi:hypothetical protein AJ79_04467 [Helicocarpus griseus UAMH5409]|uniref:Uncharacterized protein n=1 Tax=Helicocarpus griseus UAMH5409 TaxID=1447875 RepID=A0A2B7XU57_9EURO|nr:hypothetical protein AJ79_04467 [Helicocarpus griseus UAMH5409]
MSTGKYIPPPLRSRATNIQQAEEQPQPPPKTYRLKDIEAYFGHLPRPSNLPRAIRNGSNNPNTDTSTVSQEVSKKGEWQPPARRGTLNHTATDPSKLAYIVIFDRAHPFWETRHEVFCKTNIELLPRLPKRPKKSRNDTSNTITSNNNNNSNSNTKDVASSYPLFIQQYISGQYNSPYTFAGYYRITTVRFLNPHTRQLAAYLEQKFGNKPRDHEAWIRSFSTRWAVITVEEDLGRKGQGPPEIVETDGDDGEDIIAAAEVLKKSVNELLEEMSGVKRG